MKTTFKEGENSFFGTSEVNPLTGSPYGNTDFLELLRRRCPHLMPNFTYLAEESATITSRMEGAPVGTTILAMKYKDGVFIAGDRQAVEGFQVGERRIEKVFKIDEYSAIAVAGVAGPCIELAKIFQVQVEYHEKQEGTFLSLEGKANYLSGMIRSNLPAAMQGLIVIPLFAGFDQKRQVGRIFKYDVTGGRYEEIEYYATGSGGKDARASLKKLYRPDMERDEALRTVLEAIWDAADEDLATGGPDLVRDIYPTVKTISNKGTEDVPDEEIKGFYEELIDRLKGLRN